MAGKTCQICGKPSGIYPLCVDCLKKKSDGLIVKNEETGKWKEKIQKIEESTGDNSCIICKKQAKYDLCYSCYTNKNKIKEELEGSVSTFDDAKDYYNNLKYNIFRLKDIDYAKTACTKLMAIGEILEVQYKQKDQISKAKDDVINLLSKKQEYLDLLKSKNENKANESKEEKNQELEEANEDDRDKIVEEKVLSNEAVLDYRRVYPMTFRCKDGHYVRSKSEKFIDNYFFENQIIHVYEQRVVNPKNEETYYPDFFLPYDGKLTGPTKGIYIEFFGLEDNEKYMATEKKKLAFYEASGFDVIVVRERNISNVDEYLEDEIRKINNKYKQ